MSRTSCCYIGKRAAKILLPATSVMGWQALQQALVSRDCQSFKDLRSDGTLWQIDVHPATEGLVLSFSNLTDRRTVESIRSSEERLRQLVRSGSAMVWSAGTHQPSESETREWREFTGQTMAELVHNGWLNAVHADDRRPTLVALRQAKRMKLPCTLQHRIRRKDGFYRTMRARAIPVLNDEGKITEWFGTHEDCTDRGELDAQLRQAHERFVLATQATTAGIWDFQRTSCVAGRSGKNCSIPIVPMSSGNSVACTKMAPVDGFLRVQYFKCYRWHTDSRDRNCLRLGDEFCILVSNLAGGEDAEMLATLLDHLLQQPFTCAGQQLHISASIGVSICEPGRKASAVQILEEADIAVHYAKRRGRGRHCVFSQEMRSEAVQRMSLEDDLQTALRNQEFELHYQAKVDMRTRTLVALIFGLAETLNMTVVAEGVELRNRSSVF